MKFPIFEGKKLKFVGSMYFHTNSILYNFLCLCISFYGSRPLDSFKGTKLRFSWSFLLIICWFPTKSFFARIFKKGPRDFDVFLLKSTHFTSILMILDSVYQWEFFHIWAGPFCTSGSCAPAGRIKVKFNIPTCKIEGAITTKTKKENNFPTYPQWT